MHSVDMMSNRRVSCKDLGQGDCEGWLWKKKSPVSSNNSTPLALKWSKRWVVIKNSAVYSFRSNTDDDNRKAECFINLPGYQVRIRMYNTLSLYSQHFYPSAKRGIVVIMSVVVCLVNFSH